MPLGPDSLLLAPHLLAILLALESRPVWSGTAAGIGFLFNTKALFVLASCAVFSGPMVVAGFAIPCIFSAGILVSSGAWRSYLDQVWIWPAAYAANTFVDRPIVNGLLRTVNWAGFHLALLVGARRARSWSGTAGFNSSHGYFFPLAGVALGWRFFPRYYLQLLPVAVILAARGMTLLGRRGWLAAILLVIPLVRFGPRYVLRPRADADPQWSDVAMDRESHRVADLLNRIRHPGDTLYVWGYRPDVFAYTGMPAASKFLDCQALTGVPADRHLGQSTPVLPSEVTAAARRELAQSRPDFIVGGLSQYNPALDLSRYPELKDWLSRYHEISRIRGMIVYQATER